MLGGQRSYELHEESKPRNPYRHRDEQQHNVGGVRNEPVHVVVAGLAALPRPEQAYADGDETTQRAHDRLALDEAYDHLHHGKCGGGDDRHTQIGRADEQHDEQESRKHRFHDATFSPAFASAAMPLRARAGRVLEACRSFWLLMTSFVGVDL